MFSLKNNLQSAYHTSPSTHTPSNLPASSSISDPCLTFATFPHVDLLSILLCSIALSLLEQIQPSLSLLSSIHQNLDLLTPLSHLHTHSFIFLPPSILQNPISEHPVENYRHPVEIPEHPVEPLQTSCRSSQKRFLDSQTL